ncbi:hypothetical protein ACFSJY_00100 [Thalassotalea euphylliae]|uniref:hypothetical protein n=1 Tax=Thalassotalea euphylliae TaxID=1655234 RepID=UPI003633EFD6
MNKQATLLPLLCAATVMTASASDNVNTEQLHKQLTIMEKIIRTSVQELGQERKVSLNSIESTYLKGQGVLFTLRANGRAGHWGSYNYSYSYAMPPLPPMPALSPDQIATIEEQVQEASEVANVDVNVEIAKAMESASRSYERAMESLSENREELRDLRDEQRDIAHEMRDIEREGRDIEFQMRRADDEEKKALKAEKDKLANKKAKLEKEKQKLATRLQGFQTRQAAQQRKQEENRTTYYNNLSAQLSETLCLYGNGLRALPKGEHVTLILKDGGASNALGKGYNDKIHVFKKQDINACAIDKMSSKQLLEKSSAYQF